MDARLGREGRSADIGCLPARLALRISSKARDICVNPAKRCVADANLESLRSSFFNFSEGMSVTRLALPQRSPSPFSVP